MCQNSCFRMMCRTKKNLALIINIFIPQLQAGGQEFFHTKQITLQFLNSSFLLLVYSFVRTTMGNNTSELEIKQKSSSAQKNQPLLKWSTSIITPQLNERFCQCESPLPFSAKHGEFLQQFSQGSMLEVCFSKIMGEQTDAPIQIPKSNQPKFLSSLQNCFQEQKTSPLWKKLLVKKIEEKREFNINTLQSADLSNLLDTYSSMMNSSKKQGSKYRAINKQIFYQIRKEPIEDFYHMEKKIGQGSFGSVYRGFCKRTKEIKAIKVLKKRYMTKQDQSKMLLEVSLLKKLDHINIIKLDDIFYNNYFYYIVTQFCEGGTLLEALIRKKIKSEKEAAIIMRQVLSAVSYIHQLKIAHMDLKLENIVLVKNINTTNIDQCVKIIDFGLAMESPKFLKNYCQRVGTLSYMAPQVLENNFSCHSDIWSCGIILCILLVGSNPFKKKKPQLTVTAILKETIDVSGQNWKNVSNEAKMLVSGMLRRQPEKRLPINKILASQWFEGNNTSTIEMNEDKEFMDRITKYYRDSNFHAFIRNYVISKGVTQAQRQEMAKMFSKLDQDHSGFLQFKQILSLYKNVKGTPITSEMQKILKKQMTQIDQNKSGKIDFQQFLLLMTNIDNIKSKEYLDEAFDFFDRDKTGFIEKDELMDCLGDEEEVKNLIGLIDWNGDGRVSREEFMSYLDSCFSK